MESWKAGKNWSDKFLPEIKSIVGGFLLSEPPIEEDQERNTDLIVLKMEAARIACRVRRFEYYEKYKDEFTIRNSLPSGNITEMGKVVSGWGDYIFYAFADKEENKLKSWFIGDLSVFRLWFSRAGFNNKQLWEKKVNHDGSSSFLIFDLKNIDDNFICLRS